MEVVINIIAWVVAHWQALAGAIFGIVSMITTLITWVKNRRWDKLTAFIKTSMAVAENMANFGPQEKLSLVITKANQFAIDNGIKFDVAKVTALIEDGIEFSKSINARPKDLQK